MNNSSTQKSNEPHENAYPASETLKSKIQNVIRNLREFRINDLSFFDFAISYLFAYLISFPLAKYISVKRLFYLVIPVSIIVHTIFSVHTPLTDRFWNPNHDYLIKLTAIYMLFKGLNLSLTKLPIISKISKLYSK